MVELELFRLWFNIESCRRLKCFVFLLFILIVAGCEESQNKSFKKSLTGSEKIVLFKIKGPEGEAFTQELATALNEYGIEVIHGEQFGQPVDLLAAAKIARELDTEFFIMGEITRSEIVKVSEYTIHGNFSVHKSVNGNQISGITDESFTKNLAPVEAASYNASKTVFQTLGGKQKYPDKARELENKLEKIKELVNAKSPQVRVQLAKKAAGKLVQILKNYKTN